MQNRQADFAEIRRMSHISHEFALTVSFEDRRFADAAPVDSEKPECYRRANLRGSPQNAVPVEMCILC